MQGLWWQLPGTQRFVSRVIADLRDGKNVALCLPLHAPAGIQAAVRAALGDDEWPWHTLDVGGDEDERPERLLFARFVPDAGADAIRNARALTSEKSFGGKVVWLEGLSQRSWPAWKEFLADYRHACRSVPVFGRTLFCAPLSGELALDPPGEDVCLAQHHWRGTVDSLDALLFAASVFDGAGMMSALHRRIAVALAARLSLWDPAVSERMAGEKFERILNPLPLLREIARERGWCADAPREWHAGAADIFDGEAKVHSAILALDDSSGEIAHRVWSAEVGVMLPFVEERRRELIARLAGVLRVPHTTRFGEIIEDLRDLEVGHIENQINGLAQVDADTRRLVWRLREIRNCLSHLEVLSTEHLLCDEIDQLGP